MAGVFCPAMNANRVIHTIDEISYWSGKAFAWLIVAATLVISVEVFKRYILNAPTAWIFDLNNMLYGTLFMMTGAYTLALSAHVRADFVYGRLSPPTPPAPPPPPLLRPAGCQEELAAPASHPADAPDGWRPPTA